MIQRVIIITTALCRLDIHNIAFPSYKKFIGNEYDVHWFINIDKPVYCQNNSTCVENNLRNILCDYHLHIYQSNSPNFFNAVKKLLTESISYLTAESCVLWLEDDWVVNKNCQLKYFLDNFVLDYSVISLVYNKLGSFPPFLMGHKLAKLFYENFLKINTPHINPEKISRRVLRTIVKKNGIIYYSCVDTLDTLKHIKNFVTSGLIYQEHYLKINDCRILIMNKFEAKHNFTLPIENLNQYSENAKNSNKIIFLRFGTTNNTCSKYANRYFKDIGRAWKRTIIISNR